MIIYVKCNNQIREYSGAVIVYDMLRQNYKLFNKSGAVLIDATKNVYNHLGPMHLHTFKSLSEITWGNIIKIEEA